MKDLARQYRPNDWNSIIGQDVLVRTLKNEIANDCIGHVYLFTGPRGTGKTTTARVFASRIDAQVLELDAASQNGVDHIRNLRDDVLYLPCDGKKFKVYIIDEVHMLTTSAFNAFLKTLEEPPAHVIFILATTDPQKIPITVLSRCQRFDLKRITTQDIISRLVYICEEEKIQLESMNSYEVLGYIARSVDGGMRDAIKLLQKCTSLDDIITVQTVVDALGSVNAECLVKMCDLLINKDIKGSIEYFNTLVNDGIDIRVLLVDTVEYLKNEMTDCIIKNNFNIDEKIKLSDELLSLIATLRNSTQIKTLTEISFIKWCHEPTSVMPVNDAVNPPSELSWSPQAEFVNVVDEEALKQIVGKLGNLDKRFIAMEMQIDNLRFKR